MLIGKQISGIFLLFSSQRVCCHCGAHHNADLNLSGTESERIIRLRANEIVLLARLLITIHQIF